MKYTTVLFTLFGLLFVLNGCQNESANNTTTSTERTVPETKPAPKIPAHDKMTTFVYGDRNGNSYQVSADSVKYNPVTVILSSTGEYSGGDPVRLGISATQFKAFKDLVDQAFSDTNAQIDKRLKNSGVLSSFKPGQSRNKVILAPDSAPQLAIEKLLNDWIGKTEE